MEEILGEIYNDPTNSAGFSGVNSLLEAAREKDPSIKKKDVEHFLRGHRTYSLHRPRRVHFKRAKTVASGYMTDVQVDLADMKSLSRTNKGYKYILLGIDVLSKRLFAVPVKTKSAADMLEAFKNLFEQMPQKPWRIYSDLGTEFCNGTLSKYFEEMEIQKLKATSPYQKASLAERAIRNMKQRLYRFMGHNSKAVWMDALPHIIDAINHSKSRTHGLRPVDVTPENAQQVWKKLYGDELEFKKILKPKFMKGDLVRMSRGKGTFEKGYMQNWADEILEIDEVKRHGKPIQYKVQDLKGNKFKGNFYGEELAKVRKEADTKYKIEKTLRKKTLTDGTKQILVKYYDYPEPVWINEIDMA
jgi:hypothetical protein